VHRFHRKELELAEATMDGLKFAVGLVLTYKLINSHLLEGVPFRSSPLILRSVLSTRDGDTGAI